MELVRLRGNEKVLNAYSIKPTLPYDIEGVLIEKDNKNIKVGTEIGSKSVIYSLRLKEEINGNVGEKIYINKEDIISVKIQVENKREDVEEVRNIEGVLEKIGLEKNEENIKVAELLNENNIPITEENIESFLYSKNYLEEIIENMDYDSATKLLKENINIEDESLQKIANTIKNIDIGNKRKLSYKDAEKIAVKIYGRRMGKDIYDSIIALHRENVEITKENIEKIKNIIHKLQELKEVDNKAYIKLMKEELEPNIDNLYKINHSYSEENISSNWASNIYEEFIIEKKVTVRELKNTLLEIDLEDTRENLLLLQEFIKNGLDIEKENFIKIYRMKKDLKELIKVLDEEKIALLIKNGVNPEKENIDEILYKLEELDHTEEVHIPKKDVEEVLYRLKTLEEVEDRDLILLLKSGEDFKIKNLKDIHLTNMSYEYDLNHKTVEKTIRISNILNTLEDLDSSTISLASRRFTTTTLNNLYESEIEISTVREPIPIIEDVEVNLIRKEYLKVKNNLTINLIKESIEDGLNIEYMPLTELNNYIGKKISRKREIENFVKDIKALKGMEEKLISIAMKNQRNMSLRELEKIYNFTRNEKGLGTLIEDLIKEGKVFPEDEIKAIIEDLEKKSKELSDSIKRADEKTRELYKDLIKSFVDLGNSFNFQEEKKYRNLSKEINTCLKSINTISEEDLVFQFPIDIEGVFENLQIIIPDFKKTLNKNHMKFYLNINTSNLGNVKFDLEVIGRDIYIDFDAKNGELFLEEKEILKEGLNKIGYKLKSFSEKNKLKMGKENSLKIIDTKV